MKGEEVKQYNNPSRGVWPLLTQRPYQANNTAVENTVLSVFKEITKRGDTALRNLTEQFDDVQLSDIRVSQRELKSLAENLSKESKQAIDKAYENIKAFHTEQVMVPKVLETQPGVKCWRESRPIEKVGLYVPGGSAPLVSTLLMLGVPAQIAGCKEVYVASPPNKDGTVSPAICYATLKVGASKVFRIGGAQAIAAFCVGTKTIPKVDKVFGPGNQYVTAAKDLASRYGVAIDMPAGPSEVLVMADESAKPSFVAADLLSQAEHGPDSQVVLVTNSRQLQEAVKEELKTQLSELVRKNIATRALENSISLYFKTSETMFEFVNEYAAEHVIISCKNSDSIAKRITSAGSVFLGNYSPESAGDYASGTNHTLPTAGWARSTGGVSLDSFVKKITFQKLTQQGLTNLAPTITKLAELEGLDAHARAVTRRL